MCQIYSIFHEPILFMEFVNWSKLFKTSASYYNSRILKKKKKNSASYYNSRMLKNKTSASYYSSRMLKKKPLRATIIAACYKTSASYYNSRMLKNLCELL